MMMLNENKTQPIIFFSVKHGYTVRYAGYGLYVLQGKSGKKVVRKLWEIVGLIEVIYGEDEVEELRKVFGDE